MLSSRNTAINLTNQIKLNVQPLPRLLIVLGLLALLHGFAQPALASEAIEAGSGLVEQQKF